MNLTFTPASHPKQMSCKGRTSVLLYGRVRSLEKGAIGAKIFKDLQNWKLNPFYRAWDFLSIALSIIAADHGCSRKTSPDGWTRNFDMEIAVIDPDFWNTQIECLEKMFCFLTNDIWRLRFLSGGLKPPHTNKAWHPDRESVVLLSGGLDSLIGIIDLIAENRRPFAVSQTIKSDSPKQKRFASEIGLGENHVQLNHCVKMPSPENPPSDRARSIIFIAYGVLLASCMQSYYDGDSIPIILAENGFISLNPPLTKGRLGSLSTRTSHPYFIRLLNDLFLDSNMRTEIKTSYQFKTKGQMLKECQNQELIKRLAPDSTSCGRFARYGHNHCGKCLPCIIRRSAFYEWQNNDTTSYKFANLSVHSSQPDCFDDVRSAALAVIYVENEGLDEWLGGSLNYYNLNDVHLYKDIARRGIEELGRFLKHEGVL